VVVGGGKYSYQLSLYVKRDRDFGERGLLTANVIVIQSDIGCVVHLAGRCDVSDHAFSDLQAVTRAVDLAARAAMGAHQQQFAALLVVQVDVSIETAEGTGDLIDDLIDKLVEVKDRVDFLRGPLQLEEIIHLIEIEGSRVRGKEYREV
jgi:hypothetical protein